MLKMRSATVDKLIARNLAKLNKDFAVKKTGKSENNAGSSAIKTKMGYGPRR